MAQHFQSGSPYGAPYSAGSYYPNHQQFPPQQPSATPPFVQQNVRPNAGYQTSPSYNMGRFEANSQAPVPQQNFPFAPSPFTPDMLKQFANASIPPPPPPNFPPVPLPHLGFPQFAQNFPQSNQAPPQKPQSEETTSDTSDAYDPRFPQQPFYNTRTGSQVPVRQENRIDGQRKEADATSSRTMSQEDHAQECFESASKTAYPSNFDGSMFSSHARPNNPPADDLQNGSYPNDYTSVQNPTEQMSVSTEQSKPPVADARPSSRSEELSSSQKPIMRSYENKTPSELRQLAKGALLSLAPHSIHYTQLVQEGVNEHVLQQLYEELGIHSEVPQSGRLLQTDNQTAEPVSSAPNQKALSSAEPSPSNLVPQMIAPAAEATATRPPPAVSPSLERKDRIAQLLAARTGRPSPARSFDESGASANAAEGRANDENVSSKVKPAEVQTDEPHPQPEAKPESVVQAEVSNQRLEAVNPEGLADAHFKPRDIDGAASSPSALHAASALQVSTQVSSQDAGPLSSIPGLFMTSTDPRLRNNQFDSNIWGQSEPMNVMRSSQKRSYEPDAQHVDPEPFAKRRNTDTTDAMEIDPSTENDETSEGEVSNRGEGRLFADGHRSIAPAPATIEPAAAAPLQPSQNAVTDTVTSPANQTKTRLTSAQIAEKAEMLKARFLKQRAERQRSLQDGLPGLDAEVQKTRSHLTQQQSELMEVRSQIRKLEEELSKARSQEESLLEEIAQLEKQLREGVTGQKQYTDELKKLSSGQNTPQRGPDIVATKDVTAMPLAVAPEVSVSSLSTGAPQYPAAGLPLAATDGLEAGNEAGFPMSPVNGTIDVDLPYHMVAAEERSDADGIYDRDPGLGNNTEAAFPADGQSDRSVASDELVDAEATTVPGTDEVAIACEEPEPQYDDDEELRDYSEGSASMSDSGADSDDDEEGEYEPDAAQPPDTTKLADSDEGEYEPEIVQAEDAITDAQNLEEDSRDDGGVQPAEGLLRPQTPSSQMSEEMVDSPPIEPANVLADDEYIPPDSLPEKPVEEGEIDDAPARLAEDTALTTPVHPQPTSERPNLPTSSQTTPQEPLTNSTNGTSTTYHPYQSPLSSFQSFRYNEQFSKAPPQSGFRSLTYSNNINPNIPLCPTELSEGVCEDPNCEEQHFRHLGLSDDKILVSLSSANGMEEPLRKEYLLSLKRVIADLRKNGVKEFEGVANALSEHRRSFFKQRLEGGEV